MFSRPRTRPLTNNAVVHPTEDAFPFSPRGRRRRTKAALNPHKRAFGAFCARASWNILFPASLQQDKHVVDLYFASYYWELGAHFMGAFRVPTAIVTLAHCSVFAVQIITCMGISENQ